MRDPMTIPVVKVSWRLADGSFVERSWSLNDGPPKPFPPPPFIRSPRRTWVHPQDPVTLLGDVEPGFEDEARAFVEAL